MGHSSNWYTEEELRVAEILLELHRYKPPLRNWGWGRKRKRSATKHRLLFPLTPLRDGAVASPSSSQTETLTPVKVKALSPATPLSLSPTESDDKPNSLRRKKPSLKRRREYYLKAIEDLTQSKASLNQEMNNVKRYCDQLKAFNLKLKARKQELINGTKTKCKDTNLECGGSMQLVHVNASVNASNSMAQNEQRQQPQLQMQSTQQHWMMLNNQNHQMFGQSQIRNTEGVVQFESRTTSLAIIMPPSSSSSALFGHVNNNRGPQTILDLNFSPEEFGKVNSSQPLDESVANKELSRAMAAQARLRRIGICRNKNPIRNSKPLCSSFYG